MDFKEVIAYKGFWKSVLVLGLAFLVIYNIVDLLFSFGFDVDAFAAEKLAYPKIIRFIIANIVGGFIYGFVVAFLQFRGKVKREKEKNS